MKVFKWTQVFLFLTVMLHVTGSVGLSPAVVAKSGTKAVLPCPDLRGGSQCGRVSWVFRGPGTRDPVVLVRDGLVVREKSGRVYLMKNCSLLIQKVTEGDAGSYSCSGSAGAKRRGPAVSLSVVRGVGGNLLQELASMVHLWTGRDKERPTVIHSSSDSNKPQAVYVVITALLSAALVLLM